MERIGKKAIFKQLGERKGKKEKAEGELSSELGLMMDYQQG
jgi:hypothetical protein